MSYAFDLLLIVFCSRMIVCTLLSCIFYSRKKPIDPGLDDSAQDDSSISILVPAFNEEDNIVKTLNSLISLKPPVYEIIVIDDGSNDRTASLVTGYFEKHARISLIQLRRNQGKAIALNAGVGRAKGSLIATIDADTTLAVDALACASRELRDRNADAVSLIVEVTLDSSFLNRLQAIEYSLGLNFDRAGQSVVDAISILPGAATLFRKDALPDTPFSQRTRTEDADITLMLSSQGRKLVLSDRARATTRVPTKLSALLRQRNRWICGHIECCFLNAHTSNKTWRYSSITFPNFVMSTFAIFVFGCLSLGTLALGPTKWLGLSFCDVAAISLALVYIQRTIAYFVVSEKPSIGVLHFLLEPIVLGSIYSISTLGAFASLTGLHKRDRSF